MLLIAAVLCSACLPLESGCETATSCAFGSQTEFTNIMAEVVNKTSNCTQPPSSCTPYLERFALLPLAECGNNGNTKTDIARVCDVSLQMSFVCMSTTPPSRGGRLFIATVAVILAAALLQSKKK
jgi:hypothetical protein